MYFAFSVYIKVFGDLDKEIKKVAISPGSGKSEIARYLKNKFPVLDCDQVNADLLKKGNLGYQKLNEMNIIELDSQGQIIKEKLASYMFSCDQNRKQVEAILHPLIFEKMHEWIQKQDTPIVFVEMPLLFEISAQKHFDSIWCVVADLDVALSRLCTYRNFTREQALARLVSQMNPEEKMSQSNIVLRNNGTVAQLHMQIEDALKEEESHEN